MKLVKISSHFINIIIAPITLFTVSLAKELTFSHLMTVDRGQKSKKRTSRSLDPYLLFMLISLSNLFTNEFRLLE